MKRVHAARGSCRGRRAAPGIAPRGARAYAARHPRAPIPAGSGCRAPRSKLPDMHGLRPKPRSRQAGGGAQAGARGQRLAAQGAVLPARPAAVCFTASHVPPPPPCSALLFEPALRGHHARDPGRHHACKGVGGPGGPQGCESNRGSRACEGGQPGLRCCAPCRQLLVGGRRCTPRPSPLRFWQTRTLAPVHVSPRVPCLCAHRSRAWSAAPRAGWKG